MSSFTKSGSKVANEIISNIINQANEHNQTVIELLCRDALASNGLKGPLNDPSKWMLGQKKERKLSNLITNVSASQAKNHAIRFDLDEENISNPLTRVTWNPRLSIFSNPNMETRDIEDIITVDFLKAPISDICIIQRGDPVPEGYFRLYKTPSNKKANLNTSSGGNAIYLCVKKDLLGIQPHVTSIIVFFPDKGEFVPPGFVPVRRGGHACNINSGTNSERIFLAMKKDKTGNPLTDIQIIFPTKDEKPPKSFSLIDKSPTSIPADLNLGTGGLKTYLCYKQSLSRLDCLENEPLEESEIAAQRSVARRATMSLKGGLPLSLSRTIVSASGTTSPGVTSPGPVGGGGGGEGVIEERGRGGGGTGRSTDRSLSPTPRSPSAVSSPETRPPPSTSPSLPRPSEIGGEGEEGGDNIPDTISEDHDDIDDVESLSGDDQPTTLSNQQYVVDAEGRIVPGPTRKSMRALLSALYIRHGDFVNLVMEGLISLLRDSDYFQNSLNKVPQQGTLTLIDVTVEVACDRLDLCQEQEQETIFRFFKELIKHSSGRLSAYTQTLLLRTLNNLCLYSSTRSSWLTSSAGMPCTADGGELPSLKTLKKLISATVAQADTAETANYLPDENIVGMSFFAWSNPTSSEGHSENYHLVRQIVHQFVEGVINSVETNNVCEEVIRLVSKEVPIPNAGGFWGDIHNISRKLFVDYSLRSTFVTLCFLCKNAWHGIRHTPNQGANPRELGGKLLALEAMNEFLLSAGPRLLLSQVMGYQVRRIVVSCLLYNVSYAFTDTRIFSKLLKIITTLWKVWRVHVRIEFAILCEHLILRVLQASHYRIAPSFQVIALEEVVSWFDQPHHLVEMFVNYDMDGKFVSHWNVFTHLVRAVCSLARRTSFNTNAWEWRPAGSAITDPLPVAKVSMRALEDVVLIAKTLMDATGHAHLLIQDSEFRSRSLAGGWEQDVQEEEEGGKESESLSGGAEEDPLHSPSQPQRKKLSVKARIQMHTESEELIEQAIKIYKEKDSVKKAVQFLVQKNFMVDSPQEVAIFLRVYKNHFDQTAIGNFLGEDGNTPFEKDYWNQIRFRYIRAVSFFEMNLESALRLFLTGCGFRLPGEAQKVDRLAEVFTKAFWQDNHGTLYCPFRVPDTVMLLSFAIIMLNTDLHKNTSKKVRKMTKEQFISNLRGVDDGQSIDPDYLTRLYESISSQPIELAFDTTEATPLPTSTAPSIFGNNKEKLAAEEEERVLIREVTKGLRDAQDLLRALAPFTHRFLLTGIDTNISMDLVSFMYESAWPHFASITDALLGSFNADKDTTFQALDILCYALTSAIFLCRREEAENITMELVKFIEVCEGLYGRRQLNETLLTKIQNFTVETAMDTIAAVHKLIVILKDTIQMTKSHELTRTVAAKIEKKAKVLENNSFFVREGDLLKRNRTGRMVSYHFFLFSDHLIYSHASITGEYKVHEQLFLADMQVDDLDDDPTCCGMYVTHPTKSFVLVADSPASKYSWLREIHQSIEGCKRRQIPQTKERSMSILDRLEGQQMEHSMRSKLIKEALMSDIIEEEVSTPTNRANPEPPVPLALAPIEPSSPKLGKDGREPHSPSTTTEDLSLSPPNPDPSPFSTETLTPPLPPSVPHSPTSPPTTTADERSKQQHNAEVTFSEVLASLEPKPLDTLFLAGVTFWKGMTASRGGGRLDENQKIRLQNLFRVAKGSNSERAKISDPASPTLATSHFPFSESNESTPIKEGSLPSEIKIEREISDNELSSSEAKIAFLKLLFSIAPYWKYQQFL